MKQSIFLFICIFLGLNTYAQIVSTSPIFPTVNDDITLSYDATKGSAGLVGTNQVYIHTGIITASGGPGNWMNVQGNWGTDDPKVKMQNAGNDIHTISFNIKDYYGISNQDVTELGMVFRNVDGSKEGKTIDFKDIFVPIYSETSSLLAKFITPAKTDFILSANEDLPISIATSKESTIKIFDNDVLISQTLGKSLDFTLVNPETGFHELKYEAENAGNIVSETISFTVVKQNVTADDPDNLPFGINKLSPTSVRLKLYAPFKDFVFVIGDFNDWKPTAESQMFKSINSTYYWIDITGLNPSESFSYQYFVDGQLKLADPYSTLVLDQNNDKFISPNNWPNLPDFPMNASGIVSYYNMNENLFIWTDENFVKPEKTRLNIYELLIRDFLGDRSLNSLIDTLTYLKSTGINAIELMPISEFEGNDSWGYNVSFHMALDKYYGNPETLKKLVDVAHELDMAVILDVVYNHAFSQNPYAQMYWENNKPSPQSPFFNVEPKHPFNVGSDFNHESFATKEYVKRTASYWIEEFHIDGFRFDLSKGFTQKSSTDDGVFASYDAGRIATLKDYADYLWTFDSEFYVILEHFATLSEEKELSDYGMMLWNNVNHNMSEAIMGYTGGSNSNISNLSFVSKGYNLPHAISYIESHDEERLQYKTNTFGNSNSNYSTKTAENAFQRLEMGAVFFMTTPGPKMIWEMGELGYDYSINWCTNGTINNDCRLTPKPVRWDYLNQQLRGDLRLIYKAMMDLRETEELMHTNSFSVDLTGSTKRIRLNGSDNAYLMGNFDIVEKSIPADFQHDGWWYDYFTGDSIFVDNNLVNINFQAGEYRMYWDKKFETPQLTEITSFQDLNFEIYPNPSMAGTLTVNHEEISLDLFIYDLAGNLVYKQSNIDSGNTIFTDLPRGMYFVQGKSDSNIKIKKWLIER